MRIFIDADACPVKDETLKVASRHGLEVYLVSNRGFRSGGNPKVHNILVPLGPDAADHWIAEHLLEGDIVVTADIPLASRALEKNALALTPGGKVFTKDSIGTALAMRELHQYLRESGEITSQHRAFAPKDRSHYLNMLEQLVQQSKNR